MLNDVINVFKLDLKWLFEINYFFTKKKPLSIFVLIFLSISSQVLNVLIFLLPFKMIFILVSDSFQPINLYFLTVMTKNQFVFGSILLIIVLFLALIFIELLNKKIKNLSYNYFYNLEKKFHNYENDNLGMILFEKFILVISNFIFLLLLSGVLFYVYLEGMIITYLMWIIVAIFIIFMSFNYKKFQKFYANETHFLINYANSAIFILVFIYMCYELLYSQTMNFLHILIFIILLRQFNVTIVGIYRNIETLISKRVQFENIFFARKKISKKNQESPKELLNFLDKNLYEDMLQKIVIDTINKKHSCKNIQWHSLGISKIICFTFDVYNENEQIQGKFFIKLFHSQLKIKANQEAQIYTEKSIMQLSLKLFDIGTFKNFPYHIYEFNNISLNTKAEDDKKTEFMQKLLNYEPGEDLIKRYHNTHKLIYERVTPLLLKPLELELQEDENYQYVEWIKKHLFNIQKAISKLPLRIVIPNINNNTLVFQNDEVKILSLFNWSIEPIGYGVALNNVEMSLLNNILDIEEYKLAQITQQLKLFEKNINQYNFNLALEDIKKIKEIYMELIPKEDQ